jgi:hypothetical protein
MEFSSIKDAVAIASGWSRLKRGDLGQLAPRKKLLKSFRAFLEDFLRSLQAFGTEGFFVLAPPC